MIFFRKTVTVNWEIISQKDVRSIHIQTNWNGCDPYKRIETMGKFWDMYFQDLELALRYCLTRLYMDRYDEEILKDMIKLCEEYLKWFSRRTIICSLRDLIREYPFSWNEEPVPESQAERYEALIKDLIRQAIGKERQESRYRDNQEIINRVADDIGVTNSRWGKEKNFDRETFYQWVMEERLMEETETKEVKENDTLPLKKKYVPLFYKICNYMIYYSYGRHTYMPSTCRSFVKANMELMSDEALKDIVEYLKKRNAGIPEDANVKGLLKQVEMAKELIGEKRVEFFEKEEGHLYEKIGEGYIRGNDNVFYSKSY